ncbi:MAG: hypothetical protein NBV77_03395 [Bacteroidia bacterium]|nr:hypothetical protein [Bacteroidia bacterium]
MVVLALQIFACSDDKGTTNQAPKLSLLDFEVVRNELKNYDSLLLLKVRYVDENGDLGLKESDTFGSFKYGEPHFNNLLCYWYVKKAGNWVRPLNPFSNPIDSLNFNERLPYLTPEGRNKRLEGEITLRIPARPLGLKYDTVKMQVWMLDRSLNKSNTIETKEFYIKHP